MCYQCEIERERESYYRLQEEHEALQNEIEEMRYKINLYRVKDEILPKYHVTLEELVAWTWISDPEHITDYDFQELLELCEAHDWSTEQKPDNLLYEGRQYLEKEVA